MTGVQTCALPIGLLKTVEKSGKPTAEVGDVGSALKTRQQHVKALHDAANSDEINAAAETIKKAYSAKDSSSGTLTSEARRLQEVLGVDAETDPLLGKHTEMRRRETDRTAARSMMRAGA